LQIHLAITHSTNW